MGRRAETATTRSASVASLVGEGANYCVATVTLSHLFAVLSTRAAPIPWLSKWRFCQLATQLRELERVLTDVLMLLAISLGILEQFERADARWEEANPFVRLRLVRLAEFKFHLKAGRDSSHEKERERVARIYSAPRQLRVSTQRPPPPFPFLQSLVDPP